MNVIVYSLKRLSMSSSVISANGESKRLARFPRSASAFLRSCSNVRSSSCDAFFTRRRTSPREERSSKMTTRMTRWATREMWMLSRSPSWKRIENSFSPMSFASPSVAATLPAVRDASEVASTPRMSPWTAICWPFLSTRKTILALESTCRRWRVSLICWYSSSYITRSGEAICVHHTKLNFAPAFQSLRHRNLIGVFEIAADRKPECEPGGAHAQRSKLLREVQRRRLTFDVRVGRDDDFSDLAALHPTQQ